MKFFAVFLVFFGFAGPVLAQDGTADPVAPVVQKTARLTDCPKAGKEALDAIENAAKRQDPRVLNMCLVEVLQDIYARIEALEGKGQ